MQFIIDAIVSAFITSFSKSYEIVLYVEENIAVISFRKKSAARTITFINEKGEIMSLLTMTDTQKATATLVVKDSKGHPATVDGVPAWSSSDEAVAKVNNIAADGLSADVIAVDVGVCQIQVEADADLGAGVKSITGFLDVNISVGTAAVVELTAGTPEEQ